MLTAVGITGFTVLHQSSNAKADVIVVLGAGMSADGTLHRETVARVTTGVDLFQRGQAPAIHFTGGRAVPDGPSAGAQMARLAISQGIPAGVISVEERSLSTLQNALFSRPMLADAQSVILVTEAFHLPRAAASFRWMGYDRITTAHAGRFRRNADGAISITMIGREALAIWFNLGRAILWSATGQQHDHILQ